MVFLPKKHTKKQFDLRYHNSWTKFFSSFFRRIEDTKKTFRNQLTFSKGLFSVTLLLLPELAINEMVPDLICAPDFFWSPRNLDPKKFVPFIKMPYNDFWAEATFLGEQISWGRLGIGKHFLGLRFWKFMSFSVKASKNLLTLCFKRRNEKCSDFILYP